MPFGNAVTGFVLLAISLVVAIGIIVGLSAATAILLGLIVLVGALAVAVARKSDRGAAGPALCPECNGLVSPHAPYCKHCGTPRDDST